MPNHVTLNEREVPVAQLTPIARVLQTGLLGLFVTSIACAAESAEAQKELPEATLPVVSVKASADQETATGPVQGYVAKRSSTATKTDTSILETPQSVSVITREELDARGATSVIEAIRYVPGVLAETYGRDDRGFEWFTIRGFENIYSASYLDGLRQPGNGYTSQQNEPYGLERIEVLRGPSSVMYGQGDAGGVVARVSKRPNVALNNEVRIQIGNFGRRELATDVGGLLSEDGSLMYRLIALGRDNQPQNDYSNYEEKRTKRVYLAPSITWRQSDDTSLTLLSDFLDIRAGTNATEYLGAGQQRSGVLTGEPAFDRHNQRQWSLGYQFEHRLDTTWTFRQNMRTAS
ncbi:MAG: TonB-dependent receptor plug domain-containing protein, partial [Zoogloea sp.]|nr:TonB-dependent receptor plug domain-containing protein [Zoogloea sp.]